MWDLKYRPLTFEDVLGQQGPVQVLRKRLENGTGLDTSYIFSGGHGRGKTTLARILARALLCQDLQGTEPCNRCDNCQAILHEASMAYTELDAASSGTIDNVRRLVDELSFHIPGAPKRVIVFDEMHRMSRDSQDVLLKPIEDKKLVAILCTTEGNKIRSTIRSRCEEHSMRAITREDVLERLRKILTAEGVGYEDDALLVVIDHSQGHVRDILNKLEMIAQLGPVTLAAVREYLKLDAVTHFYRVLLNLGQPAEAAKIVDELCESMDPDDVAAGLAEAAMNSYRLAHKMHAPFSLMDRTLAQQVHAAYRDDVTKIADYFLRVRRVTKAGLICDVVALSGGGGIPQAAVVSSQPTVIQVAATPVAAPVPPPVAPEQAPAASATPAPAKPSEPAFSATEPVGTDAIEVPPAQRQELLALHDTSQKAHHDSGPVGGRRQLAPGERPDGIGNLGSDDVAALTEVDANAIPLAQPRGHERKPPPKVEAVRQVVPDNSFLPAPEWRQQYERYMINVTSPRSDGSPGPN